MNDAAFDDLLDHARSSRWRGELSSTTHRMRQRNPTCGDEVSLALQLREGTIQDIRFQGKGCFVSQAAASMLCERVLGQSIERLQHVTLPDLLGFDPMQISMNRQQCCLLAINALRQLWGSGSNHGTPSPGADERRSIRMEASVQFRP